MTFQNDITVFRTAHTLSGWLCCQCVPHRQAELLKRGLLRVFALWVLANCLLGVLPVVGQESAAPEQLPQPGEAEGPASWDQRLTEAEAANRRLEVRFEQLLLENELLLRRLQPANADISGPRVTDVADMSLPPELLVDEPQLSRPKKLPLKSYFDEGFKWETDDGEFQLQFHNETQLDLRAYGQPDMDPTNQFGFYIPRMRFIFNGRLTKPIEYNVSINKGLGSLDLLDAFLNFNYDSRFQMRFGRYRTPFTYDWYALSNQFLPTVERSVFAINYGYNRNFALMLHGELLDEQLDYSVALANGPRNSYFDTNTDKDFLGYLNFRPFQHAGGVEALKNLNVGGSVAYGYQDQTPLPISFRTSANATESAGTVEAVPAFLELEDNVVERGLRELWELHAAYYYKQWTLMGAWDHGFNTYGFTNQTGAVRLPAHGYHMQFGYFLTGEEVERRTFVEPLRPFDLRAGQRGPGAIELQARFDHFDVGREVFTGGLANPALWTNRVNTVDAGLNWYLNKYLKVYFDWQHSMYGQPVTYRPGGLHRTSDLFWLRCQIYF